MAFSSNGKACSSSITSYCSSSAFDSFFGRCEVISARPKSWYSAAVWKVAAVVDLGHAVVGGHGVGLQHVFHPGLLQLQLLGQRLDQRDLAVGVEHRLGQRQRGRRAEVARAIGARACRRRWSACEDLLHQRQLARRVAVVLRDAREARACLDRRLERLGMRASGSARRPCRGAPRAAGLLVQLGGLPQRVARELRVLVGRGQALELAGGLRPAALLRRRRPRACALTSACSAWFGIALAEVLERARGSVPVLQADQRGRGVVLRRWRAPSTAARRLATRAKCATASRAWPAARACSPCL